MPALSPETVGILHGIAESYLAINFEGWRLEGELGVGGSAAVFKAVKGDECRAIKVSSPKLFEGDVPAQLKRVEIQKRIVGHQCSSLVQIFALELFDKTCICVMEHIPWKELKHAIGEIPAKNIQPIIDQLVDAVVFLKSIGVIHRDIKPENILIADDFIKIKLVDLGVVKEISINDDRLDSTDHGLHRPFLATAQYSSPEYLFRTAEPSSELWEALNIYQIGAVIYDLIEEKEIFAEEMRLENRYRLALAVLSKRPEISKGKRQRNNRLASIAESCLVKNMATRIEMVRLTDFAEPSTPKASEELKSALSRISHKGKLETQAIIREQQIAKSIEESLNKISEQVLDKLNEEFGSALQINTIAAQNTENSRIIVTGIPKSSVEYKFIIGIELTEEFDFSSEVRVTLKNDKELHSIACQGFVTINQEASNEWVLTNIFESISATLIKSLT